MKKKDIYLDALKKFYLEQLRLAYVAGWLDHYISKGPDLEPGDIDRGWEKHLEASGLENEFAPMNEDGG